MDRLLLVAAAPLAALAFTPAPAQVQFTGGSPPVAAPPGPFSQWSAVPTGNRAIGVDGRVCREFRRHHRDGGRDGDDGFPRRHRAVECAAFFGGPWGAPEGWALYNNRSWESDSFNDWWHDRPERAYPRWIQNNQNCDRMWWGGGVWRCSW
jgi:hypothetical protein